MASEDSSLEYQCFPGCSLHGTAREYGRSLRTVAGRLGIALHELEDWSCCGATAARSLGEPLALALAGRNLARAQEGRKPLMVVCNLCYSNLALAARSLRDERVRKNVNGALRGTGPTYGDGLPLVHPLEAIVRSVGLGRVAAGRDLKGIGSPREMGREMLRRYLTPPPQLVIR